jgi:hypothetical protein
LAVVRVLPLLLLLRRLRRLLLLPRGSLLLLLLHAIHDLLRRRGLARGGRWRRARVLAG